LKGDEQPDEQAEGRFPALQSAQFRLLWIGLTISAVGTKMQDTTVRWHVYELTHSMVALGLIGLCRFLPIVLFSLLGGAVADAQDRRKILLLTQTALAAGAAILASLTQSGRISAASIYGVNALSAAALAFDSPARQSLIPNLVPRKHFSNAASLNSTAYKVATVVGPCLAGSLLQRGSIALIYWINAASFLAVLIAVLRIKPEAMQHKQVERSRVNMAALRDGLRFVWSRPILMWPMCLDFLATFFSSAEALMPVFAKDILRVDARGYGLLTAASAVGSVGTGATLAFRRPVVRQGLTMLLAVAVYGLATVLFGLSHIFWLSMAALVVMGAADTLSSILRQTIRQMNTPDNLRGRMTAINMIFFTGGPQLGNLEAGLVASVVGAPWSVISGGIGCLLAVAWVAARAPVMRNYRRAEAD
jgi:MFS family permease